MLGGIPTAPSSSAAAHDYSAQELRDVNPAKYAGTIHNAFVRQMRRELQRPGTRLRHLCSRLGSWIDTTEVFVLAGADGATRLRRGFDTQLDSSWICAGKGVPPNMAALRKGHIGPRARNASWSPPSPVAVSDTEETTAAFDDAMVDIDEAISAASDEEDLADRLGPIYDATHTMGGADSIGVQEVIATAMDSWAFWHDENELGPIASAVEAEYNDCFLGLMENEIREADGVQFQCQESEWRAIANKSRTPLGGVVFTLAAYSPVAGPTAFVNCFPWSWVPWMIGAVDVAGYGAAYLAVLYYSKSPTAAKFVARTAAPYASAGAAVGIVWANLLC